MAGAGEAQLALGFFSSRLRSEALAAASGKGGAGKRGRKKALVEREAGRACLSLLCLALTLPALGAVDGGTWREITPHAVLSPLGSFQQILVISFLQALYVLR